MGIYVDTQDKQSIEDALEHFKALTSKQLFELAEFDKVNAYAPATARFNANMLLNSTVHNLKNLVAIYELLLRFEQ